MGTNDIRAVRTLVDDETLVLERRRQISQCAVKVFCEEGYKGTTMRRLAGACDMSIGNLYNYIGTKDDILHLISLYFAPITLQACDQVMNKLNNASVTEILRQCIKKYFEVADLGQSANMFFEREIRYFSKEDRKILLESQVSIVHFFEQLLIFDQLF